MQETQFRVRVVIERTTFGSNYRPDVVKEITFQYDAVTSAFDCAMEFATNWLNEHFESDYVMVREDAEWYGISAEGAFSEAPTITRVQLIEEEV